MSNAPQSVIPQSVYVAKALAEHEQDLSLIDPFPQIPAMAATMLQLELLLQDAVVDLKALAEVVLSDAGATLQILRMIGEEFPDEKDRPIRIEDCIASLDAESWYEAMRQLGVTHPGRLHAEWQQCRCVGEYARELAGHFEGISPDQAYLVGLLHRLGEFPYLLGWSQQAGSAGEHHALGVLLADFWRLPGFLVQAIQEQRTPSLLGFWSRSLNMARQLAGSA